ncbi:MAG TPA: FtsQ-type POTRA domain-containing protein [Bryobacteraceae bacterium]|nr:FtsQ-type POTRA domain-containing protein [Bryobacteraceae bacterium]
MPKAPAPPKRRFTPRMALRIALWMGVVAGVAWGAREARSFLIADPRFRLEKLEIHGAIYTSRARIQNVFASDFNHGIFQIPLAERRRHVLAIDWVRTAALTRVWPDRIVVTVSERKPVAFAKLPVPGTLRHWLALIDDEGILLSLPPKVRFALPVLSGISEEQSDDERRLRVESMSHLLADLGPQAKDISEINAASAQDMRVMADVDGQSVELWLGDQHYRSRYVNFLRHYQDIRKRDDHAAIFDLRFDDRITTR